MANAILNLLNIAFNLYMLAIFIRIILSWIPLPYNRVLYDIRDFLYTITEPVLGWFRRKLPPLMVGDVGLDLSPLVAYFVLGIAYRFLRDYFLAPLLFSIFP